MKNSLILKIFLIIGSLSLTYFYISAEMNISNFGILNTLTKYYYLSIAANFLAFVYCFYNNRKLLIIPVIQIMILLMVPIFIEQVPSFTYYYRVIGYTQTIVEFGNINYSYYYMNWPGIMILGSSIIHISGLGNIEMVIIYRIIMKSIFIIVTYMFIVNFCNREIAIATLLVYALFDFSPYFGYLTTSISYIYFILILYIYIKFYNGDFKINHIISIILLFLATVIAHLMTFLVILISITMIIAYNSDNRVSFFIRMKFILIPVLLLLTFLFYSIETFTLNSIGVFISDLNNPLSFFISGSEYASSVAEAKQMIININLFYIFIMGLAGVSGLYYYIKFSFKNEERLYLYLIITILLCLPVIFGFYGHEVISRLLLYITPISLFFISILAKKNPTITFLFITVLILLFPLVAYGDHMNDYVSEEELSGINFYHEYGIFNLHSLNHRTFYYQNINDEPHWSQLNLSTINVNTQIENGPIVVAIYERDSDSYAFYHDNNYCVDKTRLTLTYLYGTIYAHKGFQLYYVN